jgi:membrane protease YdiL (CAAX protease family)
MGSADSATTTQSWIGDRLRPAAVALLTAGAVFGLALTIGALIERAGRAVAAVGSPGTVSSLLVSVAGLQVAGFGVAGALLLGTRGEPPRSYLRLRRVDEWTLFYGTAVGLAMMLVAVGATVLFQLLGLQPPESAAGAARDPAFYLFLFALSTFVAVPMEELFFRGLLQRRLDATFHPALAIALASGLFTTIHTGVVVGAGGEALALAMFFSFGLVLGTSYHLTANLWVPLIGHVFFNAVQILVRAAEVAA